MKEKYYRTSLICRIFNNNNNKKKPNELIYKTETLTELANELMVIREEGWREDIVRECEVDMYTLLYLKGITNKDLLYSTGNSA